MYHQDETVSLLQRRTIRVVACLEIVLGPDLRRVPWTYSRLIGTWHPALSYRVNWNLNRFFAIRVFETFAGGRRIDFRFPPKIRPAQTS
jgi:hypothetical protein